MEKNRLFNTDVVEVSLVPAGAIRKRFLVTKSEEGNMPKEQLLKQVQEFKLPNEQKIDEVLKAGKLSDNASEALKGAMRLLGAVKEELPAEVKETILPDLAACVGYTMPTVAKEEPKPIEKEGDKMPNLTPVKKEDGSYDYSAIPEDIRPQVEALWKEKLSSDERAAEAVKKAEEHEKVLKAEKDEQVKKEFIAKAAEFKHIAVKADEFGPVMKELHEKAPEAFAKVEATLKAAEAALKEGKLFAEIGSSQPGQESGDAWEKINKIAEGMVAKDESRKLTKSAAIAEVLKTEEGMKLYGEYEAAQSKGGN